MNQPILPRARRGRPARRHALQLMAAAMLVPLVLPLPARADASRQFATEPGAAPLEIRPAAGATLEDFRGRARLVVVMADSAEDAAFIQQMDLISARPEELAARDVVVLTDTDPGAASAVRQKLRPRGFSLVLIDKDGQVAQRKPMPWDVREIMRAIDKMPIRQEELRNRRFQG